MVQTMMRDRDVVRVERDRRICFKLTHEEKEDIARWAGEEGMSPSSWVRKVVGLSQPEKLFIEIDLEVN